MNYLLDYTVHCPYCGESFETSLDTSLGSQDYFEDCNVCCRPIRFVIEVDPEGDLGSVVCMRDDE